MDYQSYLSHNVAVNLKRIRTSKGMSLDVLSEQTGVSKSMLAQIEKGTANPSLGVLGKITSGLRIEFQELIDAPPMESCLVTPDQMTPTKEMIGEYKVWTCFPYEDNHQLEIYRIDIEPGANISVAAMERRQENIFQLQMENLRLSVVKIFRRSQKGKSIDLKQIKNIIIKMKHNKRQVLSVCL